MLILNIIIAVLLAGMGSLTRLCPDLMSGYNTMTKEQKQNFDVEGASRFLQKTMIITSIFMILGTLTCHAFHIAYGMEISAVLPIVVMVVYLVLNTSKFDHNPRSKGQGLIKYLLLGFLLTVFGIIALLICSELKQEEVLISKKGIIIPENRSELIKYDDIKTVVLKDSLLDIGMKRGGFGFGEVAKGHFDVNNYGDCFIYIYSKKDAYIEITTKTGKHYFINYKEKLHTRQLFEELQAKHAASL